MKKSDKQQKYHKVVQGMRIPQRTSFVRRIFDSMTPESWFAVGAVVVLILTTIYWSWFSAIVNAHNADQLVGQYIFEHSATLHNAVVPGAHSFILKWPLFFVVQSLGGGALIAVATVLLCLLTVVALMVVLYKINQRPFIFGMLCLALAVALLLTPTEPYPGALLPVNMAMLSTRNIEYILYIVTVILVIKAPRLLHWKNAVAVLLLTLLIASDKLFLAFTLGGASLMLIVGLLRRRGDERNIALRWLVAGAVSIVLAVASLKLVNYTGLLTVQDSAQAAPYALIHDFKSLVIGFTYGVMGLLTEVGANPAFDAIEIKAIPGALAGRLFSIGGIAFLVALATFVLSIFATVRLLSHQKPQKNKKVAVSDTPVLLSFAMIWTTVTAFIVFVLSSHYQPVDARYLAVILFAAFIVLATWTRTIQLPRSAWLRGGSAALLLIAITIAMGTFWQQDSRSNNVYAGVSRRDEIIISALNQHPVKTLIGDYWRVFPIKNNDPEQTVFPLDGCMSPRNVLTSKAWAPNDGDSFAYLLSYKPTSASYNPCSLEQIIANYGRPSATQLIAGTQAHPEEMLLFYDYGTNKRTPAAQLPKSRPDRPAQPASSTILPKTLTDVARTDCPNGKNIMNIVAHQDDDLLFINPETYHNLQAGDCVRSVYITAGDAGLTSLYWLGREEGTKAAYATMLHLDNPVWQSRTISLSGGSYATIARLQDSTRVSLIFMHLPDGNMTGQGFNATHFESLARLRRGNIATIHTVDGQSSYTSDQLTGALVDLMNTYHPAIINTQARINHSKKYPDHSDHLTAGWYAEQAYNVYLKNQPDIKINYYIGYPERERPVNVTDTDAAMVDAAFFAYARHDSGTCESTIACSKMSYGYYLNRQYLENK